jgi:GNAT superfamily N-acetyltransferase
MIRRFSANDAEQVSALIRNTLLVSNTKDYDYEVVQNLQRVFSAQNLRSLTLRREVFVYEHEGEISGTISLEGNTIYSFFIAPDKQRLGIGADLLSYAEDRVREEGYAVILIAASLTAVGFYEKHGYIATGTGGDSTFGRTINMRKPLQ